MRFEYDLTRKQRFYLTFFELLPNLELIQEIWDLYRQDEYQDTLTYYESVSPFREHICGDSSVFGKICGIDPDMFDLYISPRQRYLSSIKIIGHPYFLCKVDKDKSYYDDSVHYFHRLMNTSQIKLTKIQKTRLLNRVVLYLLPEVMGFDSVIDDIMRYIFGMYKMYRDTKILNSHPIAIDRHSVLLKFE